MSWSSAGYEKASYCISQTGRHPAMQSPIAVPMMPASARGVSTQRSGPKRSSSPAVARKTPPARPTSSPITMTSPSRSSSTWKASLIASTMLSSANDPPQLVEIRGERSRRIDERVLEQERRIGGGLRLGRRDPLAHQVGSPRLDLLRGRIVEDVEPPQVCLVASDALALLLLLDALEVDVRLRVVGGRMRRRPIRDRLDE